MASRDFSERASSKRDGERAASATAEHCLSSTAQQRVVELLAVSRLVEPLETGWPCAAASSSCSSSRVCCSAPKAASSANFVPTPRTTCPTIICNRDTLRVKAVVHLPWSYPPNTGTCRLILPSRSKRLSLLSSSLTAAAAAPACLTATASLTRRACLVFFFFPPFHPLSCSSSLFFWLFLCWQQISKLASSSCFSQIPTKPFLSQLASWNHRKKVLSAGVRTACRGSSTCMPKASFWQFCLFVYLFGLSSSSCLHF